MAISYQPVIVPTADSFDDLDSLQASIERLGLTHVRATNGQVWRIFNSLNQKSVPLNHATRGPQRLPFNKVESFGHFSEGD